MSDTSRRGFLAIAGVGAAGVAAASVVGASSASAAEPHATEASTLPHGASGSIVAYVSDVHDGELSVMVGERAVVVQDRDLVARLARAAAE
jgi:hypothetical protein